MQKWQEETAQQIFSLPFNDLLFKSHTIHRENFNPNEIQVSTLLSIKTGACPENCSYCPQSGHHDTGVKKQKLMLLEEVVAAARRAKAMGSTRFCMGAAWRNPKSKDLALVTQMVKEVKALGMETCATLGLLTEQQAKELKEAGLDFYNHNIDTSPEFYKEIITTRSFDDRIETLKNVRDADLKICCGGIIGMGETNQDRIKMLVTLANLPVAPESVPINKLIRVPGTPLANQPDVDPFDFIRTIALARILMPTSYIRLSAGREEMPAELQSLCFFAGANSIFYGEKLFTSNNASPEADETLFSKLGLVRQELPKSSLSIENSCSCSCSSSKEN